MLGWFRALMPREGRFFELFIRHADVTLSGARALRDLLNGAGDVVRCCNEVNAREEEADAITRDVLRHSDDRSSPRSIAVTSRISLRQWTMRSTR
jgi:uncharacterized protein Yka (UPF0111/DUF47 family)